MNAIKKFYKHYVTREDKFFIAILLITCALALLYILINQFTHNYPSTGHISWQWKLTLAPILLGLGIFSLFARKHAPRMAFLTWTYSLYFFSILTLSTFTLGLETTPFSSIDSWLLNVDRLMGFHQLALLNWTYAHHCLLKTFRFFYAMINIELLAFPIILALMLQKKAVKVYLLSFIFSALIGFSIYYFFPSSGPVAVLFNPHFTIAQANSFIQFFEIHHHLQITTSGVGIIAFPSFHVIWSILLAYSMKNKKYLFYPIIVFNSIIIASTLFLGWHYLMDVIAGVVVSVLAIWIANVLLPKLQSDKHTN